MAQTRTDLTHEVQGTLPRLLVPEEAAEFLRVSMDQLYHLTSAKKIPFLKVGGQLRFEIDTLLKELRAASTAVSPSGKSGPGSERTIRLDHDGFTFPTPKRRQ